jgi:hypothetical protein
MKKKGVEEGVKRERRSRVARGKFLGILPGPHPSLE